MFRGKDLDETLCESKFKIFVDKERAHQQSLFEKEEISEASRGDVG